MLAREGLERDVEYVYGDSVTGLTEDASGVRVTFERGAPRTFDLVVGADGLHSNVRRLAFGEEARFVRHLGLYVAIFSAAPELARERWELFYAAPGRLANVYGTRPGGGGTKALLAFASPPLAYERHDVAGQQRLLADAFEGEGWQVPRLLESMGRSPDFYFDSMSQVHLERWSSGRVALVGDAAYCPSPSSGQGSSLALVGAYVLAGELAAAQGDHRAAFARYEDVMRPYVAHNLAFARRMAREMVPRSRAGLWLRLRLAGLMARLPWKGLVARSILEPLRRAASAIALPDYAGR